jgi:hypothetical protein
VAFASAAADSDLTGAGTNAARVSALADRLADFAAQAARSRAVVGCEVALLRAALLAVSRFRSPAWVRAVRAAFASVRALVRPLAAAVSESGGAQVGLVERATAALLISMSGAQSPHVWGLLLGMSSVRVPHAFLTFVRL